MGDNLIEALEDLTFEIDQNICAKLFKSDGPETFGKDVYKFNGKIKLCWFAEYYDKNKFILKVNIGNLSNGTSIDQIKIFIELAEIKTNIPFELLGDDFEKYDMVFVDLNNYQKYVMSIDFFLKGQMVGRFYGAFDEIIKN